MSDQATATTRAEALQSITGRDSCPFLMECNFIITKRYFVNICVTPGYVKCHNLAKMMGELKDPMGWLWRITLEQEKEKTAEADDLAPPPSIL